MDHAEATETYATNRYLLGELSAAEADAFEEHYFDCVECADDLRVGMQLMSGGRGLALEQQARDETPAPVVQIADRRPRRASWIPAAVAAAMVLAVTLPVIVGQRIAASAPSFEVAQQTFLSSGFRTEGDSEGDQRSFDGNAPIVLSVDIPSKPTYSRYEARLHRPDGPELTLPIAPDPKGEATTLTVRGLSAGPHELVIMGMDPAGQYAVISRNRFIVRR